MKQVIHAIREYCTHSYENIAVAENITSGCLQMLLGSVEHADQYFQGGITTLSASQLRQQLGIEEVSSDSNSKENLARTIDMAREVARRFNSEIGIAINGCSRNEQGLFEPSYAAIVRFNKVIYAEKLLPSAQAPSAVPIEYAQRVLYTLAEKLIHDQEELLYTTAEVLEPLS